MEEQFHLFFRGPYGRAVSTIFQMTIWESSFIYFSEDHMGEQFHLFFRGPYGSSFIYFSDDQVGHHYGVKKAHSPLGIPNRQKETKTRQHFLHMGVGCHTLTNHAIYVHRGTTSTVYFICRSRTNKTEPGDTRSSVSSVVYICQTHNKNKWVFHLESRPGVFVYDQSR